MHGHHDDDDDHDDDNDRSRGNSNPSTWHENNLRVKHGLTSRIERYGGELRSPSAGPRDPGSDLAAPSLLQISRQAHVVGTPKDLELDSPLDD